ncbi:hypothetical protein [Pannonibacter sp. I15F10I1]|nr:hypothetical protein [Pannonibacter sp. I15F10I1]
MTRNSLGCLLLGLAGMGNTGPDPDHRHDTGGPETPGFNAMKDHA